MIPQGFYKLLISLAIVASAISSARAAVEMQDISYMSLPGEQLQIKITLSGPAPQTGSFVMDNPSRIAIDFPDTTLALEKKSMVIENGGAASSLRVVEAGNRSRLVLNMTRTVPHRVRSEDNYVYINIDSKSSSATAMTLGATPSSIAAMQTDKSIMDIDFRRGEEGDNGKIIVRLKDPSTIINMVDEGGVLRIDFLDAKLPQELERRLDVADFATPVKTMDAYNTESGVRMTVTIDGEYEHMAYQAAGVYTVVVDELTEQEIQERRKKDGGYTGERLSLNFQNIEVRAVLQLIADFTGLNVVASDTVSGSITLRLKNVPWDQALDIVLKTRGLGMRKTGNVMLIAPQEELAAREQSELQAQNDKAKLEPLYTRYFTINYADAANFISIFKSASGDDAEASLLSSRGTVVADPRTNSIMVKDTTDKLEEIAILIEKLDVPVTQVLIESRIVIASSSFTRDFGAQIGYSSLQYDQNSNVATGVSGSLGATDSLVAGAPGFTIPSIGSRLNSALPAGGAGIAMTILGPDYLVDLELTALQSEGNGEVVSTPRVVASHGNEASIQQGVEIPFQSINEGTITTVWKKAVLGLTVKPVITPDDRVAMDLVITKDSLSALQGIDKREITTNVLVDNGQTIVLGGIYEETVAQSETKVPLLGDIPLLGALFRTTGRFNEKSELLVFITPRILKEALTASM